MLNNAALLAMVKKTVKVTQIACSGNTTWYVTKSGELYGCGYGSSGQQGSGSTDKVNTFTKRADNVAQVVCSDNTTWYVTNSDELYGCGKGVSGQQGSGSTDNVTKFTKRADNVAQVVCSGDDYYNQTTWYVTNSGELYGCGSGSYGQQGNESTANVNTFTKRP